MASSVWTMKARGKRYLYELLEANLTDKEGNTAQYAEGITDQIILNMVLDRFPDGEVTGSTVTGTRNRAWGKLYKEPVQSDKERIAELEGSIVELKGTIVDLQRKIPFELPTPPTSLESAVFR